MQVVRVEEAHEGAITALALSRDGGSLMTGGADKLEKVWKLIEA